MPKFTTQETWLPITQIKRWYKIQASTLRSRGVRSKLNEERITVYDMDEVWDKCSDIIYKKLHEQHSIDSVPQRLNQPSESNTNHVPTNIREIKLAEEYRKLKIDNDLKEGQLVAASGIEDSYMEGMRIVCDKLDRIPFEVKMSNPDIAQSDLETIDSCIKKIRNNIANDVTFK